jgi:type I restriction enzyme S subunit
MRDGWVETTLDGIAEYINGYPFKPADLGEAGLPVIRIKQLLDPNEPVDRTMTDTPDRCLLKDGDIVFSWSGTLAVRIWNRGPAKLNQHLFRVVEKKGVYKGIIPLILDHAIEELEEKSHGTTMKHITKQTLLPHKVLLPPLPEQNRIVDLISSVDSYIEALQQQLESAKRSRNAVLHELLTAGGHDWVETTLDEIADVIMGQSPDGKSYNQEGKGLPFMQGSAEFGEHNPVPEKWCSDPKKIAEPGDLLLSVRAPVGDTNFADQRIAIGRGLSIIRANKGSLTEFIRLAIQLNVAELIASSGSGMFASITGKNLKEFKVNLPPLPEQKRIVEIVNTIDEVISQTELTTSEAKNLRSGLLSDLLSGEHEIPTSYDKVMGAA